MVELLRCRVLFNMSGCVRSFCSFWNSRQVLCSTLFVPLFASQNQFMEARKSVYSLACLQWVVAKIFLPRFVLFVFKLWAAFGLISCSCPVGLHALEFHCFWKCIIGITYYSALTAAELHDAGPLLSKHYTSLQVPNKYGNIKPLSRVWALSRRSLCFAS